MTTSGNVREQPAGAHAAEWLLTLSAVRERAKSLFRLGEQDALPHFAYHPERLAYTVDYVVETIRGDYPDLDVPFHSRWRHFAAGGRDRWALLSEELRGLPRAELARIRIDLAVTSVLLDAGAGPAWRFREGGAAEYARSEGLAVASFHLFRAGAFSAAAHQPYRADASALERFDAARLADGFQVAAGNPLVGLAGRAELLRRLGAALVRHPDLFGAPARIGTLYDSLCTRAVDGAISIRTVFAALIRGLGEIWPGRHALAGVNLGDTWRHGMVRTGDAASGLVPFHKLSQWLTYSLIEPLADAGLRVTDLDALTGLPEYRNGGLFVDSGVLMPRDPDLLRVKLQVGDEAVVEWRALSVALLDRLADGVRARLGLDAEAFPLAKVLQGGTWAAGRRIAHERRPGGPPPLSIESDGTVF